MSAKWTVRSAVPNNGLVRAHLVLDGFPADHGQEEYILLNVVPKRFGDAFMEGDLRGPDLQLISRAGRNGKDSV